MWYLFILFIDAGNPHSENLIEGHITKKSKNAICKETNNSYIGGQSNYVKNRFVKTCVVIIIILLYKKRWKFHVEKVKEFWFENEEEILMAF